MLLLACDTRDEPAPEVLTDTAAMPSDTTPVREIGEPDGTEPPAERDTINRQTEGAAASAEIARLINAYDKGQPVRDEDLVGRWILVRQGTTEEFNSEIPTIEFNVDGLRRMSSPDVLEWTLTIRANDAGVLEGVNETVWTEAPEKTSIARKDEREFRFTKETGGDFVYEFDCRQPAAGSLICGTLDFHYILEFTRRN